MCRSGQLEASLKAALQRLSSQRRYEFWSQYVRELVCVACENEEGGVRSLSETQMLISAWRTLLILSTSHVSALRSKRVQYIYIHNFSYVQYMSALCLHTVNLNKIYSCIIIFFSLLSIYTCHMGIYCTLL